MHESDADRVCKEIFYAGVGDRKTGWSDRRHRRTPRTSAGLIETCLKKDYPEDYERIIAITYKFSFGWRRIHNPDTNEYVADNLTTTEFTIAMLASRGWTNQEIADYMKITSRTVKQHMTCIFNKISISNRKQLKDYMLR